MKLSKDKSELRYNDFLTLRGIPAGNRSALEWFATFEYRLALQTGPCLSPPIYSEFTN